jgi:hypothetical protein
MQRESEEVASVISCLFLLEFRDNPAQGKSNDFRLHTGSLAYQRDGTRLLNFVAALTIKVDLYGASQICNRLSRTSRRAGSTWPTRRFFPLRQWKRPPLERMPKENAEDLGKRWRFFPTYTEL